MSDRGLLRPRPPPFCVNSAGAAEAWGPFRPLTEAVSGIRKSTQAQCKLGSVLSSSRREREVRLGGVDTGFSKRQEQPGAGEAVGSFYGH